MENKGGPMLQQRRLGKTGVSVSLIGLGGIPIMRVGLEEAVKVVQAAVRSGINLIDTARGYGDSEEKIGSALKTLDVPVFLASKSPKRDREGLLEDFEKSASDLGVDRIDLYQAHCVNTREDFDRLMGAGGGYEALLRLRSKGRIGHIGITSHNSEMLKAAIETTKFETIQALYSIVEDDAAKEVIPMARQAGLGILAMKPFGGGCIEAYDIALRFVLSDPSVIALPGMADLEEVRKNITVAEAPGPLTDDEIRRAARIKKDLGSRYCRRCDYCQPCPNDIPIAFALHIPSVRRRVGDAMMNTDAYRGLYEKLEACSQCGTCEERCPFGLPVMDLIEESRSILADVLK
jgi:predicted aldo/keto reductase-like oxidoreductase